MDFASEERDCRAGVRARDDIIKKALNFRLRPFSKYVGPLGDRAFKKCPVDIFSEGASRREGVRALDIKQKTRANARVF